MQDYNVISLLYRVCLEIMVMYVSCGKHRNKEKNRDGQICPCCSPHGSRRSSLGGPKYCRHSTCYLESFMGKWRSQKRKDGGLLTDGWPFLFLKLCWDINFLASSRTYSFRISLKQAGDSWMRMWELMTATSTRK